MVLPPASPSVRAPSLLSPASRRRAGAVSPAVLRWIGVGLLLIVIGGAVAYALREKPPGEVVAAATEQDYQSSKPASDDPKPTEDEIAAISVPLDEMETDAAHGSTVEVKASLTVDELVDNPKDLNIGMVFMVKTVSGDVKMQFDAAHFQFQDCGILVRVTDPAGKELQVIKGLTRDSARRKMAEINDAEHNVEAMADPDAPAKFLAKERDFFITVDGDPTVVLNEECKAAFGLDRVFYIANPVKK